jgi:hypothetical protein
MSTSKHKPATTRIRVTILFSVYSEFEGRTRGIEGR